MKKTSKITGIFLIVLFLAGSLVGATRIAITGDTRFGAATSEGLYTGGVTYKQIQYLNALTPAPRFIYNGGDITGAGSEAQVSNVALNAMPAFNFVDNTLNPPVYIGAMGNHDDNTLGWRGLWKTYFPWLKKLPYYDKGDMPYSQEALTYYIHHDNILWFVFNGADNKSGTAGELDFLRDTTMHRKFAIWAEEIIQSKLGQFDWLIGSWHYPMFSGGGSTRSGWRMGAVLEVLTKYNADFVFGSHQHLYERTVPAIYVGKGDMEMSTQGMVSITHGASGRNVSYVTAKSFTASISRDNVLPILDFDGLNFKMEVYDIDTDELFDQLEIIKSTTGNGKFRKQFITNSVSKILASPNPSKGGITFSLFQTRSDTRTPLNIYDAHGALIRTLDFQMGGTQKKTFWDGRDNSGKSVPNGSYFARTPGNKQMVSQVMILR